MPDHLLKPSTEGNPLRVVAAVLFDGSEVLACRRKPEKSAGGLWEFPGGKIEPGEAATAALIREIWEKLSTPIVVEDELSRDASLTPVGWIELVCLQARLAGARPTGSSDHDRLVWLRPADLGQLQWALPGRPAARRLLTTGDQLLSRDSPGAPAPEGSTTEDGQTENAQHSWATSPGARRSMLGNRGRDTRPEMAVRSIVHGMGLRYRVDHPPSRELRTRGDLVFPRRRVVVFIDGCFWHGCPLHYTSPKSNARYWSTKVVANRERDTRTTEALTELGWTVLRFWTHQPPAEIAEAIRKAVIAAPPSR